MSDTEHPIRRALIHVFATGGIILGYLSVVHAAINGANDARLRWEDLSLEAARSGPSVPPSVLNSWREQAAMDFHNWYGSVFVMNSVIALLVILIVVIGGVAAAIRLKGGRSRNSGSSTDITISWPAFWLDGALVLAFAITLWETHTFCRGTYVKECGILRQSPIYGNVVLQLKSNVTPLPAAP